MNRIPSPGFRPAFERCEGRALAALVVVLNGNAFAASTPSALTADAAQVMRQAGHEAVELSTPAMDTPRAFRQLTRQVAALAGGGRVGVVGFSAGGTLAARLAGAPRLRVSAALDYYGPTSLGAWFDQHRGDAFERAVRRMAHPKPAVIRLLSGPAATPARVVGAFGTADRNATAAECSARLTREFPNGQAYTYEGGHGVAIRACPAALADFLAHL